MLPEIDGLEVCKILKHDDRTAHIPIVMPTVKGEETDIVTGLELGADDYITKPFSPSCGRWRRSSTGSSDEWDEYYATFRAYDMKIPEGKLTEEHWKIIRFLRESWEKNNTVPNVYETCEATGIQLEELEHLFPDGYHRGAVKIAGLKVR